MATEQKADYYPQLKQKGAVVKIDHHAPPPPPDPYELSTRVMPGFLAPGVISCDHPIAVKNSESGVVWVIDPNQGKVIDAHVPPSLVKHYQKRNQRLALAEECRQREERREGSFTNKIRGCLEDFMTLLKTGQIVTIDYQGNTVAVSSGRIFRHGWRDFPMPGGARFTVNF